METMTPARVEWSDGAVQWLSIFRQAVGRALDLLADVSSVEDLLQAAQVLFPAAEECAVWLRGDPAPADVEGLRGRLAVIAAELVRIPVRLEDFATAVQRGAYEARALAGEFQRDLAALDVLLAEVVWGLLLAEVARSSEALEGDARPVTPNRPPSY